MGDEQAVKIEVPEEVTVNVKAKPTIDEAKEAGLSPAEIEMAKKQDVVVEKREEKDDKKEEKEEKEEKQKEEKVEDKPYVFKELTDEEMDQARKDLKNEDGTIKDKNLHGLYSHMRRDRKRRRDAEAERDRLALKLKV